MPRHTNTQVGARVRRGKVGGGYAESRWTLNRWLLSLLVRQVDHSSAVRRPSSSVSVVSRPPSLYPVPGALRDCREKCLSPGLPLSLDARAAYFPTWRRQPCLTNTPSSCLHWDDKHSEPVLSPAARKVCENFVCAIWPAQMGATTDWQSFMNSN